MVAALAMRSSDRFKSDMVHTMNSKEFFDKHNLEILKFEDGLLASFGKTMTQDQWTTFRNVPTCKGYEGAIMTCFCDNEDQLMAAVASAVIVSDFLEMERKICGEI